jgi:hypothetical protein
MFRNVTLPDIETASKCYIVSNDNLDIRNFLTRVYELLNSHNMLTSFELPLFGQANKSQEYMLFLCSDH